VVEHQVSTALSGQIRCPDCGTPHRHKDSRRIVMRTLFGTLRLDSPPLVELSLHTADGPHIQPTGPLEGFPPR